MLVAKMPEITTDHTSIHRYDNIILEPKFRFIVKT
jgi:hypothetical protein